MASGGAAPDVKAVQRVVAILDDKGSVECGEGNLIPRHWQEFVSGTGILPG